MIKNILRSAVVRAAVGNAAGPISMIAVAPLLARALGPEGRGLVAAATVPYLIVTAALTLGMPEALTYAIGRQLIQSEEAFHTAQKFLLLGGGIAAAIMWFAAPLVAAGSSLVETLIRVSAALFVPSQLLWGFRGRAQGIGDWKRLSHERIATSLCRVTAMSLLYATGHLTVISASISFIVTPLVGFLAYAGAFRQIYSSTMRGTRRSASLLLSFGLKVWVGSIAGILLSRFDQLLLAPLSNAVELGYYSAAVNVGDITLFFTSAVGTVLLARESSHQETERVIAYSSALCLVVMMLTLILCATANWWLPFIFGASFRPSIVVAEVLLLSAILGCSGSIAGWAMVARGWPAVRSGSLALSFLVNSAAIVVLAPKYGALGAAIATMAGVLTYSASNLLQLKRRCNIPIGQMIWPSRNTWRYLTIRKTEFPD